MKSEDNNVLITNVSLFHSQKLNATDDERVTRLSFKCPFPLCKLNNMLTIPLQYLTFVDAFLFLDL